MIGDDPFDRLVREFFGSNRDIASGTSHQSVNRDDNSYVSNLVADYDTVDDGGSYYVVVNFSDLVNKSDIHISIEDDFDTPESEGWFGSGDKVLSVENKAKKNSFLKVRIPKKIAKRKIDHTFVNGILEVSFGK